MLQYLLHTFGENFESSDVQLWFNEQNFWGKTAVAQVSRNSTSFMEPEG
jgi:hypothetical protein